MHNKIAAVAICITALAMSTAAQTAVTNNNDGATGAVPVYTGSSTLGKGLVQTIAPLPDGGDLLITWSRVLAPLGWPIQGLGVLPQVCTSLGVDELSRQLAGLKQGQSLLARALQRHRSARAPLPPAEMLEIRNACPAAEGRDTDLPTARTLIETPAAYSAALLHP